MRDGELRPSAKVPLRKPISADTDRMAERRSDGAMLGLCRVDQRGANPHQGHRSSTRCVQSGQWIHEDPPRL